MSGCNWMDGRSLFYFLFLPLLTVFIPDAFGQAKPEIEQLEREINKTYGIDKLKGLITLSTYYMEADSKKAVKYSRQAVTLSKSIFTEQNALVASEDRPLKALSFLYLGQALYQQKKYSQARTSVEDAYEDAQSIENIELMDQALTLLDDINTKEPPKNNLIQRTLRPLNIGPTINAASLDLKISTALKMAKMYENKGNHPKAVEQYSRAVNFLKNKGDAAEIARLHTKIAELNKADGKYGEALAFYQMSTENYEKLGDTLSANESKQGLEQIFEEIQTLQPETTDGSPEVIEEIIPITVLPITERQEIIETADRYRTLALEFEQKEDYDQSLKYYKLYADLNSRLVEEERRQAMDSIELQNKAQQIRLLVQEKDLNEMQLYQKNVELGQQEASKRNLLWGLVALSVLSGLFYWLFLSKRRAHKRLKVTYLNLETTKTRLALAEKKIKRLLGQQVSDEIAQALLSEDEEVKNISKFVCIMFLDIRDFTPFAEKKKPEEIIAYQNDVFGFMIEIIAKHHGVINQFMGDGFMATFGAPVSHGNDAENAFLAAAEILEEVNSRSNTGKIAKTKVGIGLHAGQVVAGNVGTEIRKQYSITGNTVITAARIEQLNKTYKSQLLISETVAHSIEKDNIEFQECIETTIKGREKPIKIYKVA